MESERELRQRDEKARDRDDEARDREETQADEREEQFAEREEQANEREQQNLASRLEILSTRNVQLWATFVIIIMIAASFVGIAQRNDAIEDIQMAAVRIESAATHADQLLVEIVEGRETPEAVAQAQRVRAALREIAEIRALLCSLPDLTDHPDCQPD